MAKPNALQRMIEVMERRVEDPEKDPLYRIYQKMDLMGFRNGMPVLQAGLPAHLFRENTIRIQSLHDGHTVTTTMAALVSTAVQAALEALSELIEEKPEDGQ